MAKLVRHDGIDFARRKLGQQGVGDDDSPRAADADHGGVGFGGAARKIKRADIAHGRPGAFDEAVNSRRRHLITPAAAF